MQLVRSAKFKVLMLAALVCILTALPTFARPVEGDGIEGTISADRLNCVITIRVTASIDGTYYVNIWDDGTIVQDIPVTLTASVPKNVTYDVTHAADTGAPGIGIYFGTTPTNGGGPDTLALIDPFNFPFPCAPTCAASITADAVVGSLPDPTRAYWAPGKITPDVVLNAGTYWVVGESKDDAGNPYYEIVLACQYLYIPANTMSPSFEGPWQGQPLPTNAAG